MFKENNETLDQTEIGKIFALVYEARAKNMWIYGFGKYCGEEIPPKSIAQFNWKLFGKHKKYELADGTVIYDGECKDCIEEQSFKQIVAIKECKVQYVSILDVRKCCDPYKDVGQIDITDEVNDFAKKYKKPWYKTVVGNFLSFFAKVFFFKQKEENSIENSINNTSLSSQLDKSWKDEDVTDFNKLADTLDVYGDTETVSALRLIDKEIQKNK